MIKLIKPSSESKAARITFYIFEITAAVYFLVMFIVGIVVAADRFGTFMSFVAYFFDGILHGLILYGVGRIIDLLSSVFGTCECEEHNENVVEEVEVEEAEEVEEKPVKKSTKKSTTKK